MAQRKQGWTIDLPVAPGPPVRAVNCELEAASILRLRSLAAEIVCTVEHNVDSARMPRKVRVSSWPVSMVVPAGILVVDCAPGSAATQVHAAISPASGIEGIDLATVATQGPVTPISRGQELDLTGADAFIDLLAGLYTFVVESTEFWVLCYGAVTAVPLTGAAEITSVPFPPFAAVNVYCPDDVRMHVRLVKAGTGSLWIARQQ